MDCGHYKWYIVVYIRISIENVDTNYKVKLIF